MQLKTLDLSGRHVKLSAAQTVLRRIPQVSYRMIRDPGLLVNSDKSKVLRQKYAFTVMNLLKEGHRIVNVDESNLDTLTFLRYGWQRKDLRATGLTKQLGARLTLIAAIDSDGRLWYTLSHSSGTGHSFSLFLQYLAE